MARLAHPRKQPKRPGATDPAKFCNKTNFATANSTNTKTLKETSFTQQIHFLRCGSQSCESSSELKDGIIFSSFLDQIDAKTKAYG